ncbi:hypothetical protein [Streptomyces violascens]|uniref:hypothetical protein n=1 Tax=Streptomyces violascens TaxID=67381 RepID=UPI00369AAF79
MTSTRRRLWLVELFALIAATLLGVPAAHGAEAASAAFMRAAQAASGRDLTQFWEEHRIRAHDS